MREIVVVNDTNIFIDLFNIGLLDVFFSLPWQVHTTKLVMYELLREGQQETVLGYKESGLLHISSFEADEILKIGALFQESMSKTNLSFADCSVWYYAKVNNYVLLTGDRKLRTASANDGVEVHGILHVMDKLVEFGKLTYKNAIEKLEKLYSTNPRLPQDEKDKRLKMWKYEIEKKGDSL